MPTWMVVEDEPDIYDVLLAMFGLWGINGVAFVDGSEAIAWIDSVDAGRVQGSLPELAILDIRLPDISGPEVGARLRRSPILHDIAIVLMTAFYLTPDEEREAIALCQADLLLHKPLPGIHELRQMMDQVLARRKAARVEAPVASSEATSAPVTAQAVTGETHASATTPHPALAPRPGAPTAETPLSPDEASTHPAPPATSARPAPAARVEGPAEDE